MRYMTKKQLLELARNKDYQMIMNAPPPDHTALRRDAEAFARWIEREHKKERASLQQAYDSKKRRCQPSSQRAISSPSARAATHSPLP